MKLRIGGIRHIATLALLVCTPMLQAEEKAGEAGKGQQLAMPEQPKFIGVWESKKEPLYIDIAADGRLFIVPHAAPLIGTWKLDPDSGRIEAKLRGAERELEMQMQVKLEDEDKASITIEGDAENFVRVDRKLDSEKFIGTWKSFQQDAEDKNLSSHYIVIREKGGKGTLKSLEVDKGQKIYCTTVEDFTWRVVADVMIEGYSVGTDEQYSAVYGEIKIGKDKISFVDLEDDTIKMEDTRVEEARLPDPPAGFKKVAPDEFWEIPDEGLGLDDVVDALKMLKGN